MNVTLYSSGIRTAQSSYTTSRESTACTCTVLYGARHRGVYLGVGPTHEQPAGPSGAGRARLAPPPGLWTAPFLAYTLYHKSTYIISCPVVQRLQDRARRPPTPYRSRSCLRPTPLAAEPTTLSPAWGPDTPFCVLHTEPCELPFTVLFSAHARPRAARSASYHYTLRVSIITLANSIPYGLRGRSPPRSVLHVRSHTHLAPAAHTHHHPRIRIVTHVHRAARAHTTGAART